MTLCSFPFAPQAKKLLRAQIFGALIKMGQAGLPVDPELYSLVRTKLASTSLCGKHAFTAPEELPPPPEKPQKRRAAKEPAEERPAKVVRQRFAVDCIVQEQPPTKQVWHRYLVRWSGYQPSWEAWRIPGRGTPGQGPIETWEKATSVKKHYPQAVSSWEATKASTQPSPQ